MIQLLKSYQKKLTNLTANNRSLVLLKPSAELDIDFNELDFSISKKSSFELLEQIITNKKKITICDFTDTRDEKIVKLSKRIAKIKRKENLIFEERGSKDLAIGYPFVRGKLVDGTIIRAPLVVFPVELELQTEKNKSTWTISQQAENQPFLNKSLLIAYAHFTKISFDDDFFETVFEDNFEDALVFRNYLYNLLKESKLDINFNRDIFINKLQFFDEFKRSDFEIEYKNGELKLFPEAILGIFPERGSVLSADYEEIIAENKFDNLTSFFESKFKKNKIIKEEHILTAFPIDASQEAALIHIKSGKSMVVQGPPGTGKSQLICNLITDFISNNKKVLVVSQKKAALDVVYNRLITKQLNNFVAVVHDFKLDRKKLFQQLAFQIDNIEDYKQTNDSLDAIWLEKEFLKLSRNIDSITEKLTEFKLALFDNQSFGITAKELYLLAKKNHFPELKNYAKYFNFNSLELFIAKTIKLIPYAKIIEKEDFEFKNRVNFNTFSVADLEKMVVYLDEIQALNKKYTIESDILNQPIHFFDLLAFEKYIIELNNLKENLENAQVYEIIKFIFEKNINQKSIEILIKNTLQIIDNEQIEFSIKNNNIDETIEIISETKTLFLNFYTKTKWKLFSKTKIFVTELLKKNDLKCDINGIEILEKKLQNRRKIIEYTTEIYNHLGLKLLDNELNTEEIKNQFQNILLAFCIKRSIQDIFKNQIKNLPKSNIGLRNLISEICNKTIEANQDYSNYLEYLLPEQISKIIDNQEVVSNFKSQLQTYFHYIVQYDKLVGEYSKTEKEIFEIIKIGIEKKEIITQIQHSFYNFWIDIIEEKNPILRSVSTFELSQLEQDLQKYIEKKQEISGQILLLKLRELTYKNLEINRLNNRVTYRDLHHQTTKKKKIWAIRKLLENHFEEIMKLVPCWLSSPETVSSIFPLSTNFDLVIFDEASQCFAEKGLPVMFRGNQICVVGDDKQLPPNDLYQPRFENESEDSIENSIDSLLNLTEKYVPQTMLLHHYRSKFEELISFSNAAFYQNKLIFIPENADIIKTEKPIEYLKTHGIWKNNVNQTEAEEVVKLVFEIFTKNTDKSVGVVTFNAKQQELIEDLMWQQSVFQSFNIPTSFFVKNIENVQGDERDIIIFSIAYASDTYGKINAQFGSLNQLGGENRLNVAITRAREKIYIVASIFPQQLQVENTINEGPKLLKRFLEYAYNLSKTAIFEQNILRNTKNLASKLIEDTENYQISNYAFADALSKNKLILTDDNSLYSSISIKDFFAYKPLELLKKNWKFERNFSRNYWLNQKK